MIAKQYISFIILEGDIEKQEILIAELNDFGFDGFEQNENEISANGLIENINVEAVQSFLTEKEILFTTKMIDEQNWNAQWEQSFEPIVIENFCAVRASFHQPVLNVLHEVIITPKMSFGTGHHATTFMMLEAMQYIDFEGKSVIDFGTGTGILAILAEKLGANKIDAIDYDDWCIKNGHENIEANKCTHINLIKASGLEDVSTADIILANINKQVILSAFTEMTAKLKRTGILLISGILENDYDDIITAATQNNFHKMSVAARKGWLCICFGLN
jgi:ribosomal protein L11 methyltransferase